MKEFNFYTEIDRLIFAIRIAEEDYISGNYKERESAQRSLAKYYKKLSQLAIENPEDFTYKHYSQKH